MERNIIHVEPRVGIHSLVGVRRERPVAFGNYFSLRDSRAGRVYNMWAENLEALVEQGVLTDTLEVATYRWIVADISRHWDGTVTGCVVIDKRVPPEYLLQHRLCTTGAYKPPLDIARDMFDMIGGDPNNELEAWTDPTSYYAKRGGTYKDGMVTYAIPKSTKLPDIKVYLYGAEIPSKDKS